MTNKWKLWLQLRLGLRERGLSTPSNDPSALKSPEQPECFEPASCRSPSWEALTAPESAWASTLWGLCLFHCQEDNVVLPLFVLKEQASHATERNTPKSSRPKTPAADKARLLCAPSFPKAEYFSSTSSPHFLHLRCAQQGETDEAWPDQKEAGRTSGPHTRQSA